MNFLGENQTANYLDTGVWTSKAIKEAKVDEKTYKEILDLKIQQKRS